MEKYDNKHVAMVINNLSLRLRKLERVMHVEFGTLEHILVEKGVVSEEDIAEVREQIPQFSPLIQELDKQIKELEDVVQKDREAEVELEQLRVVMDKAGRGELLTREEQALLHSHSVFFKRI